jgi:hypothetical protein
VTSGKVTGSIPDCDIGIFHWHNPSGRTMALGLNEPLTEISKVKQSHYRPPRPLSFQVVEVPRFLDRGGKVVSPKHWPPLPSRTYSWYLFLLEAELTPGRQCNRQDYVNEKFQWHHRESNLRPYSL